VDDAGAGSPETDAVARRSAAQEVVDLPVRLPGALHVAVGADVGLDEMVAVDGGGYGGLVSTGEHELEQRHLGGRILHGDAIRVERHVALCGPEVLVLGVGEVAEEDLLPVAQGSSEAAAGDFDAARQTLVGAANEGGCRLDGGHGPSSWRARA
jgi:hypothetical protein